MSFGSLNAGVSALKSFQEGIEVIGNNVANADTTAFKGSTVEYSDSFSTVLKNATTETAAEQVGTGVNIQGISTDFTQGTLATASSESDLAISGNGFFQVVDPTSKAVFATRAGDFSLNSKGNLVTSDGYCVQGLTGGSVNYTVKETDGKLVYTLDATTEPSTVGDVNILFTPCVDSSKGTVNMTVDSSVTDFTDTEVLASAPTMSSYSIGTSGTITITLSDGNSYTAGTVLVQNYKDQSLLQSAGDNLYTNLDSASPTNGSIVMSAAGNSAGTNGLGSIEAKALEGSNVDLSSEFAELITAQRAFQAGSRIITVADSILEETINLKRQ